MSEQRLPLFPLPVVLFPNSSVPLHIFEERYKTMIRECVEQQTEFGITLLNDDKLSDVGCSARVVSVTRRYDDGRMDITVRGNRRYRILRTETHEAPYAVGYVSFVETEDVRAEEKLAVETVKLYNDLVLVVYKDGGHRVALDAAPAPISFVLAQKSGMDLLQRQRLLELDTENERLMILRSYLQEVIPKLKKFEEVERVIRSDGYLPS